MKKLPKRPRTFGRTKAKPYHKKKQKTQSMFLNERFTQAFDEMLHSSVLWHINYDEHGQYASVGIDFGERIQGLNG